MNPFGSFPAEVISNATGKNELDTSTTAAKIRVMQKLGVPYPEGYDKIANQDLMKQADQIAANLQAEKEIESSSTAEIIALIAYLQRLGVDINTETNLQNQAKK